MAEQKNQVKANFFVRAGKKIGKFCSDLFGELKKVTWTTKAEVVKSTELVLIMVIVLSVAIAIIDLAFSNIINLVAGIVG